MLNPIYFIQSDNLYLLIGLFITFIFNAVIDIIGLTSAILFLVFSVSQVFFFLLYLNCILLHEVDIF